MGNFLHIIACGLLIGILVSAPMGPIGMLCIQRTLNKGRWPAFFTGVGAALSDLTYCLLTGLGISLITDFITANQQVIQIIGSVVLIAYGIYLFRKKPVDALKPPTEAGNKYHTDFATGFLLTFSNPLILFIIIGLFARFNFFIPEYRFYHYIIGYVCIFTGAIFWWYMITKIVDTIRSRFNMQYMVLVNRIIGTVIIVMAAAGCFFGIEGLCLR